MKKMLLKECKTETRIFQEHPLLPHKPSLSQNLVARRDGRKKERFHSELMAAPIG